MPKVINLNKRRAAKAAAQPEAPDLPTTALALVEKGSAVPKIERSLEQLVSLIKAEIKAGRERYVAAGHLLLEAKAKLKHGEFIPWITEHFALSYATAKLYMRAAANPNSESLPISSLNAVRADPSTRRKAHTQKVVRMKVKSQPAPKVKVDWAFDAYLSLSDALKIVAEQKINLVVKGVKKGDAKQLLERIATAVKHLSAVRQALKN